MKIKKNVCNRDNGFIVPCLTYLFAVLEKLSIFYFIRWIGNELDERNGNNEKDKKCLVRTGLFSEVWVLGNIILAIVAQNIIKYTRIKWLAIMFMFYAIERIWEMFVYQINVLFFHRLKNDLLDIKSKKTGKNKENKDYFIISATRTVILLLFNMAEYILHFAVIYTAVVNLGWITSMEGEVWQSFQIFMSMGDLQNYNDSKIFVFAYIETILGMFMNIACLAYFIGMLPDTKSKM